MVQVLVFVSTLFISVMGFAKAPATLECQFWSSSTGVSEVLQLEVGFEAFQTIVRSCVYQDAQAPGIDQVGLCVTFERDQIDREEPSRIQLELISGVLGVYRNQSQRQFNTTQSLPPNFVISAEYGDDLFTAAICSWQLEKGLN